MDKERFTGRSWQEWDYALSLLADGTRRNYTNGMMRFLEAYDLDTEELYQMHYENTRSEDPRDSKKVPRMVGRLMKKLIDSGELMGSTSKHIYDGVSSFFRSNVLPFDMKGEMPEIIKEGKDRMTKDQIRTLLDATGSYRNKSIITMMKDTGLRESDIVQMRVKHVLPIIKKENKEFHSFTIRQEKTNRKADPVFGPDATKYLRLWWKERENYGIGENPDDHVFCIVEDKPSSTSKTGITRRETKAGDPLKPGGVANMIYHLIRKTGLQGSNISGHSLRKFHETQLGAGSLSDAWIDVMTGRIRSGSKKLYTKPDEDQLIRLYSKAYRELSLERTHDLAYVDEQADRILELEAKVDELSGMIKLLYENLPREKS